MSEGVPFRRMKYPYTFTAKFAQFPYAYYTKHSWLFRYWHIGVLLTIPIFYKIQKLCMYIVLFKNLYIYQSTYKALTLLQTFSILS